MLKGVVFSFLFFFFSISATKPQAVLGPTPLIGVLLDPWVITGSTCQQYGFVQGLTQGKKHTQEPDRII